MITTEFVKKQNVAIIFQAGAGYLVIMIRNKKYDRLLSCWIVSCQRF